VIQRALAAGKRVRVVFSTSGDGYPRAAARLAGKRVDELEPADFIRLGETRRAEAVAADALLGLGASDLLHLGFPDGAFLSVLLATGTDPITAPLTQLAASPTTGAPYTASAALEAFATVLSESGPEEVYVTDFADDHSDHRATCAVVAETMRASRSNAQLFTFLVHAAGDRWPDLGPTFERKTIDGTVYPQFIAWPPPIRRPLTGVEADLKRRALMRHASQWALDLEYLGAFVKSEEVFWPAKRFV
jgi:LmbE family N-acetylglucosaminyl deacetylase